MTMVVTVSATPDAGTIGGLTFICTGLTSSLTSTVTGGTWSSSTLSVGTVSTTGVVAGIAAGTTVIAYTVTNGCGTATATVIATVGSTRTLGPITGTDSVCAGQTTVLSNSTGGGVWSSATPSIATISTSGVVTGIAPGYDTIVYTVTTSCDADSVKLRIKVRPASACPLDVSDVVIVSRLLLYPNPNDGSFKINISSGNEEARVMITDMTGRKVDEMSIPTNKETTVKLNQPPGIYFVSAVAGNERYFVKVLVQ